MDWRVLASRSLNIWFKLPILSFLVVPKSNFILTPVELSDGGEDNDSSPDEVFIHFYDPDDPDDRSTILASKTRVVTEPDGSRTKVVHVQKFIQDKSGGNFTY